MWRRVLTGIGSCHRRRTLTYDISKHFDDDHGPRVHLLDEKPSQTVELSKEDGLRLYKDMHEIRVVENACAALYREKLIRGFCHLYTGQEAVAVGLHESLIKGDSVITSYRCHGWILVLTHDIAGLIGELLGKSIGFALGKGGSMHIYTDEFYGGNGIVGGHVPLGVGIALKHQYTQSKNICVCCFGDGAFVQGQVSEAFNIAKLRNVPIMFVVENNRYGMGTSTNRSSANDEYYRFCSFLPGIRTNGNDILSVMQAAKFAVKHLRDGNGPILLEMMTYRYFGHSMSDPGTSYRGRDEVQKVRTERDCIKQLGNLLTKSNLATEEELTKIKNDNEKRLAAALEECKKAPVLGPETLTSDIYTTYPGNVRMPQMMKEVPHKNLSKFVPVNKN